MNLPKTVGVKVNPTEVISKSVNILKAKIKISLCDVNGNFYNDDELLSIILHEIGHALGIGGHSRNLNDVMYYSTNNYKNGEISKKDVNTVVKIYHN